MQTLQGFLLSAITEDFGNAKHILIVTFLPSEQWELFQAKTYIRETTVVFPNWVTPWNTSLLLVFAVLVPPPSIRVCICIFGKGSKQRNS